MVQADGSIRLRQESAGNGGEPAGPLRRTSCDRACPSPARDSPKSFRRRAFDLVNDDIRMSPTRKAGGGTDPVMAPFSPTPSLSPLLLVTVAPVALIAVSLKPAMFHNSRYGVSIQRSFTSPANLSMPGKQAAEDARRMPADGAFSPYR